MLTICLAIYYSLGTPCSYQSDNNTSACTDYFCDKNVSTIFVSKNFMDGEICISYVCFGIPKKTLPACYEQIQLFETCNILMYIILIKRKKKKKRIKKIFHLELFVTHATLRILLSKYKENLWTQKMIITKTFSLLCCTLS